MPYVCMLRPITVDQRGLYDASLRAGSAGVSAPLAEFYMARGRSLRPKARTTLLGACRTRQGLIVTQIPVRRSLSGGSMYE